MRLISFLATPQRTSSVEQHKQSLWKQELTTGKIGVSLITETPGSGTATIVNRLPASPEKSAIRVPGNESGRVQFATASFGIQRFGGRTGERVRQAGKRAPMPWRMRAPGQGRDDGPQVYHGPGMSMPLRPPHVLTFEASMGGGFLLLVRTFRWTERKRKPAGGSAERVFLEVF